MAIVRYSYRGYKLFRNVGFIILGAALLVISIVLPRIFGMGTLGAVGIAQADAPGGGGGGGGTDTGGGTGGTGGDGGGFGADACGGDGGGDCSY